MTYYAKSLLPNGKQPTVSEHLRNVAKMSRKFGAEIGMENEGYLAGIMHDFGKYSEKFQQVLRHEYHGVDHAFCGAARLVWRKEKAQKKISSSYRAVIEAVNGHHSGLTELSAIKEKCRISTESNEPIEGNERKTSALAGDEEYTRAWMTFMADFPDFAFPRLTKYSSEATTEYQKRIEEMLRSRMLFSCLVDADWSVSANEERTDDAVSDNEQPLEADKLLRALRMLRDRIKRESKADGRLNSVRDVVFERCGDVGDGAPGLYTLTAPTGTGKTLALMHFALRQCIHNGQKRVIIVLPFLTLTEQSADTYRKICPNLIEDHSQSNRSILQTLSTMNTATAGIWGSR